MLKYDKALWRVEYRTDLTRAAAPAIPLAYVLDAGWANGVRWLGMLFRKRITTAELDLVALETWPEIRDLEKFMSSLFDEAWSCSSQTEIIGSRELALKYSMHSALYFAGEESAVDIAVDDPVQSFPALYAYLLDFRSKLAPIATAAVLPFKAKPQVTVGARGDVELEHKAA